MKTLMEQVKQFHTVYKRPIGLFPALPDKGERALRMRLLAEEFEEYMLGEETNDLVEIADALGDMAYIIAGTAIVYGIPLAQVMDEIQRANMSKLGADGQPLMREDGKILKGPNYTPPNIQAIIDEAYFAAQKVGAGG